MKSVKIAFIALIALVLFADNATAQSYRTASYNTTSTSNYGNQLSYAYVKSMMSQEGYTLASDDYFTITEGAIKFKNRTLYSGNEYVFIVLPLEGGVNDLDLSLYDAYGNLIKQDNDSQSVAMFSYDSWSQRNVQIKVKNYDSNSNSYPYDCRLLVYYK